MQPLARIRRPGALAPVAVAAVLSVAVLAAPDGRADASPRRHASSEATFTDRDLDRIFEGHGPRVSVSMGRPMLRLASAILRLDDDARELAAMCRDLRHVSVRIYDVEADRAESARRRVDRLARRLNRAGWDSVARVREDGDRVTVFMRPGPGDSIDGVVMVVFDGEDDQAIFVDIAGRLDLDDVAHLLEATRED